MPERLTAASGEARGSRCSAWCRGNRSCLTCEGEVLKGATILVVRASLHDERATLAVGHVAWKSYHRNTRSSYVSHLTSYYSESKLIAIRAE